MRVLAMVHAYPPFHNAGGEITMHTLLAHLAAHGHQVDVQISRAYPKIRTGYQQDGVQVFPYKSDAGIFAHFDGEGPDVVITHLENTMRAAAICGQRKVPLVHLIHNDHMWTKGCFRRGPTNLAIFNTDWMASGYADYWASVSDYPQPPHTVIHPVVDPALFAPVTPGKAITLINLNEEKGGSLFWELAGELPKRSFLGVRGAYGDQIVLDDPDTFPNVEVLAHQPPEAMPAVYGRTRILLMPSSYESYGRTAIEAAYCGIPTIAHPTNGLVEALGEAGTFVERDDVEGWKAAISRLSTPKGWAKASEAARTHALALRPDRQLQLFTSAIEGVVRRGFATIAR